MSLQVESQSPDAGGQWTYEEQFKQVTSLGKCIHVHLQQASTNAAYRRTKNHINRN